MKRTLSWRNLIWMIFIQRKKRAPILQDDARVAGHHSRTESAEDAVNKGDSVTFAVNNRQINRVAAFENTGFYGRRGAQQIDFLATLLSVILADELRKWSRRLSRIGDVSVAVGKSEFLGFDHQMNVVRAVVTHR